MIQDNNQYQSFYPQKDFELSDEDDYQNNSNNMNNTQQSKIIHPLNTQQINQQQYYSNPQQQEENSQIIDPNKFQDLEQEFVACPQHLESKVTQICQNDSCNEPLCTQCIVQHKLYHQELGTEANIISINQVRVDCIERVDKLMALYNKNKSNEIGMQHSRSNLNNVQNNLSQLKMARKQIEMMVSDYFNELEKKLSVSQGFLDQNQYEYYDNLKQELQSQYYIQALLEVLENKDEFDENHIQNAQKIEKYENSEIVLNQQKIYNLKKELADFVYLKNDQNQKISILDNSITARSVIDNKNFASPKSGLKLQNLAQSVPTQQQQQKHQKQPIFASPTPTDFNKMSTSGSKHYTINNNQQQQQQQPQQSQIQNNNNNQTMQLSGRKIQEHNLLPISHSPQNQFTTVQQSQKKEIQQQNIDLKKKIQEQQIQDKKIPQHKVRLQRLSQIDDKLSRLKMRLDSDTTNLQSQRGTIQGNNNYDQSFDQQQGVMNRIAHKYDIPVSNYQQSLQTIDVTVQEQRDNNQILAYFQENSKKMYMVDCSSKNIDVNDITLKTENLSFKVPQFHRSVVTPTYGTFLIGGIFNSSPPFVSTDHVYQIDHKYDKELKLHSRMNYNRSSPGVCQNDNEIYVCGGFDKHDESSSLDTFEKLDLITNKWIPLARCNFKSSGCALTVFSNRYIFKFGGRQDMFNLTDKIEYYDIKTDEWHIVVLPEVISQSVQIPSDLCALQINDSQILFFGGLIHSAKQNCAYILEIEFASSDIIDNNKFQLKKVNNMSRQAAVTGQPIIREGEVLSFVDSINMNDISVSFYNRKCVVSFNGTTWKEI